MSAVEGRFDQESNEQVGGDGLPLALAGELVEVRRNAGVAAAVGLLSSATAIAYLARASTTGAVLDWALVVILGLLGAVWLRSFVDARTPLLVADGQGVRVRLGRTWRGLPWSAVDRVEHTPRQGFLSDGRLNIVPRNPELLLAELDRGGARQAKISTRLYGSPLALPLGLTTRVSTAGGDVTDALRALADRGAEVVVLVEEPATEPVDEHDGEEAAHVTDVMQAPEDSVDAVDSVDADGFPSLRRRLRDPRPLVATALTRLSAALPSRVSVQVDSVDERGSDDSSESPQDLPEPVASATPEPARDSLVASRSETLRASASDETEVLPRTVELVDDTQTWGERVRPIARQGHPVAPLVVDDFALEPAADPVVGPELSAARTRLALSVDQLAERTRIRPHVIEAMEVDDFVPCGGDFYARGHLRTLARVLGIDVAPLLVAYDERYAHAPIDPRRVFEAELATGSNGPIRGTRGGANWSILVAAVMALVLVWSVARLAMDTPSDLGGTPVLNGSGGPHAGGTVAADPVPVVVTAPSGGAQVVIRDSSGAVVFKGNLAIGETKTVKASPPLRVQTSDGSVLVDVDGVERGPVGEAGTSGQGTYASD